MIPSTSQHSIVIVDNKLLDKVINLLVESRTDFRVVDQSDSSASWMVAELNDEFQYENSQQDWNNSSC